LGLLAQNLWLNDDDLMAVEADGACYFQDAQ
jgi:hypothetical protein